MSQKAVEQFFSLREHFKNNNYNYLKYNGKFKLNQKLYNRNYQIAETLYRRYYFKEYVIASILLIKPENIRWIGDINNNDCITEYNQLRKNNSNLLVTYQNDLLTLRKRYDTMQDIFNNEIEIANESWVILDKLTNCFTLLEDKDYVVDLTLLKKYSSFFIFNDLKPFIKTTFDIFPKLK